MDSDSAASAGPNSSPPRKLSGSERQRLEHLCDELELRFDIDNMSAAEGKQVIGELEKRAARRGQEDFGGG